MPYKAIAEVHMSITNQRSEIVVQLLKELQEKGRGKRVPLPGVAQWRGGSNSHGIVASVVVENRIVDKGLCK